MQVECAKCYDRMCKHYNGYTLLPSDKIVNCCEAFPNGIPDEIAFGENKHLEPLTGQPNDIVFETDKVAEEIRNKVKKDV